MSPEQVTEDSGSSSGPPPEIIDIELEPFYVGRVIALALPLGLLSGLLTTGVALVIARNMSLRPTPPKGFIYFPVVLAALMIVAVLLFKKWSERRAYRLMVQQLDPLSILHAVPGGLPPCQGENEGGPSRNTAKGNAPAKNPCDAIGQSIEAVLNKALHRRLFGLAAIPRRRRFRSRTIVVLKGVTRGLIVGGARGLTVRACAQKYAVEVQPIEVPIEPLPLDESVPFVGQLGDEHQNDFDTPGHAERQAGIEPDRSRTPDESDFRRKLKRQISLVGGRWVFGLFLFAWVIHALDAVLAWRITWPFVMWTAMLAVFAFGVGGRGAWRSGQQWLIVPGGLVTRKANRRGGWDVHLFDRRESVLTAYRHTRYHWFICVADEHKDQMAVVTPTESIALLRAWLSPLPPPPIEQLQELAG